MIVYMTHYAPPSLAMDSPHPYHRVVKEEKRRGRDFTHHHHRQDTVRAATPPPRPAPDAESYFPYMPPLDVDDDNDDILDYSTSKSNGLLPPAIDRRQSPRPYHHRRFQEIGDYHPSRFVNKREPLEAMSHFSDDGGESDDDDDADDDGDFASDDVAPLSESSSVHSSPLSEKRPTLMSASSHYEAYKAAAPPSPTSSTDSFDEHIDRFARVMRSTSRRQRLQAVHIHAEPPPHSAPSSTLASAHHVRQHFHQRNVSRTPIPDEFMRHSVTTLSSRTYDYADDSLYRRRHSHSVSEHRQL